MKIDAKRASRRRRPRSFRVSSNTGGGTPHTTGFSNSTGGCEREFFSSIFHVESCGDRTHFVEESGNLVIFPISPPPLFSCLFCICMYMYIMLCVFVFAVLCFSFSRRRWREKCIPAGHSAKKAILVACVARMRVCKWMFGTWCQEQGRERGRVCISRVFSSARNPCHGCRSK